MLQHTRSGAYVCLRLVEVHNESLHSTKVPHKCHALSNSFLEKSIDAYDGDDKKITEVVTAMDYNGFWGTSCHNTAEKPLEALARKIALSRSSTGKKKLQSELIAIRDKYLEDNSLKHSLWEKKKIKCNEAISMLDKHISSDAEWKRNFLNSCQRYTDALFR